MNGNFNRMIMLGLGSEATNENTGNSFRASFVSGSLTEKRRMKSEKSLPFGLPRLIVPKHCPPEIIFGTFIF